MPRRKEFVLSAIRATVAKKPLSKGVTINIGSISTVNIAQDGGIAGITGVPVDLPSRMDDKERLWHYRVCHAIAKQFDLYPEMRKYMRDRWRKSSMRDLSDQALRMLLEYMREFERAATI